MDNPPTWININQDFVKEFMDRVHKSPFSRVKSVFADITEAEARAKGYTKGNRKVDEVFKLLKRVTGPTTVYKKQTIDRDDVIDITDFDVVAWLKAEMRVKLDEELVRAMLVGDGRSDVSADKISELSIRPIWTDDDLFTIKQVITVAAAATEDDIAKAVIKGAIKARKNYRGTGNPIFFTNEDVLGSMLLLTDTTGRDLYETTDKLTTKLRVSKIVTSEVMEKGAVITLNEGGEGFATPKHLVKEDGTQAQKGEELDFQVIEFVKDSKRIILSHSRTFEPEKELEEKKARTAKRPAAKKDDASINNVAASQSLGDFDALANLKAQMEKGEE